METRTHQPLKTGEDQQLIQTLLNTASPRTAQYRGHAVRVDYSYGVVVSTREGFKTITLPARALDLMADGIVVTHDCDFIRKQLGTA